MSGASRSAFSLASSSPQSSGKKGDHLIGDYYVLFDKHYREEVAELSKKYVSEGMGEEEAKEKAEL